MMDREQDWALLMRAARQGERKAYELLLANIAEAVRGIVRRRLARLGLSTSEAEDVVQEVLLGIHKKRDTWDESRPFLPWVHAVARHKITDAARHKITDAARHKITDAARRLRRHARLHVEIPIEDWPGQFPSPVQETDRNLLDVERLLSKLPARQQSIVQALTFEGASVRGVAERFSMSEGAVRVAFHRAVSRLAGAFSEENRPGSRT
jgi:RNA polymerase sigma-70 factor (ECF subfamily)